MLNDSPHVIGAQAILSAGQGIFDLGIRERHRGMAAERESLVASTRFVQAMSSFMQSERL